MTTELRSRGVLRVGLSSVVLAACLSGGLSACTNERPKPVPSASPATVSAATWAHDVCGAVKPWSARITNAVSTTRTQLSAGSNPEATKGELLALFADAQQASSDALATVEKAGVPRADKGAVIATQFVTALRAARDNFAKAAHSVQQLSTADRSAFFAGVVAVGTTLSEDNKASSAALAQVDSPELETAFAAEPACH